VLSTRRDRSTLAGRMFVDGVRDDHHEAQTDDDASEYGGTTNMTSPQARNYRDNRQHGPNVPRPQTRNGPAQGGAPAAGLSTPAELEGTAQESLTGVQWRS
jgi:hypothetical protein